MRNTRNKSQFGSLLGAITNASGFKKTRFSSPALPYLHNTLDIVASPRVGLKLFFPRTSRRGPKCENVKM